jgi:hypothetical protein
MERCFDLMGGPYHSQAFTECVKVAVEDQGDNRGGVEGRRKRGNF